MGERQQSIGRRRQYEFDDVLVDRDNYRVLKAGQPRPLGPRAFDVLLDLLQHRDRVVSKAELIERVWGGVAVTDNALTRAVKEIRAAIGDDASAPRYVETVARRGYRFSAGVHVRAGATRAMLAVLPFSDLSGELEDHFCDGLTEEMITRIAQLNAARLGVIARTSSMSYRNTTKTVADIVRELNVDYVLEGSVRRDGDRIRISAQLIEAGGQTHVWADSFEAALGDVLRVPARAAESVARAIRTEVQPQVGGPRAIRSVDPEAYAAYLKGRYLSSRRRSADILEAIGAFQAAIGREPTFAPAYAGLARCCASFFVGVLPRADAQPMAEAAVRRSLELDDRLAEAHVMLGVLESIEDHLSTAERAFRHAVLLDPSSASAHHSYAMLCLVALGRFEHALDELAIARMLDPLALINGADVAVVHYLMRRPDRALEQCRRILELDSAFARAHLYAGWAHAQRGELDDAVGAFETAKRLDDSPFTCGWLGYGYGRAGRRSEAARSLEELRRASENGREVAFFEALVHTGVGDADRAFERLEQARAERALAFGVLRYLPVFDDLRPDRRFDRLLDSIDRHRASADHEAPQRGG